MLQKIKILESSFFIVIGTWLEENYMTDKNVSQPQICFLPDMLSKVDRP